MTTLVRFDTDEPAGPGQGQASVVVEVSEYDFGMQRVSRDDDTIARAGRRLEDVLEGVRPTLRALKTALCDLGPGEHEIEFGIKLNIETGVVIAKATTEGHFTVKMRWKHDGP